MSPLQEAWACPRLKNVGNTNFIILSLFIFNFVISVTTSHPNYRSLNKIESGILRVMCLQVKGVKLYQSAILWKTQIIDFFKTSINVM